APANVWHQGGSAFGSGSFGSTSLTSPTGGVQLAPTFSDDFAGTTLGAGWAPTAWATGGTATVSGGSVSVAASAVASTTPAGTGGVSGSVSFGAGQYQIFGLATGFSTEAGNYWAVFGTLASTNTLYARVNVNGSTQNVSLGALPTGFHTYTVQPVAGGYQFLVDGVLKTTISATMPAGAALKASLSSFTATPVKADWIRLLSSSPSGTFTSQVFDAAGSATWGTATWTASVPAGTTLTVQTRSGNAATPDGTWSSWAPVANGGQVTSPAGRYLQYRVTMTTTNPQLTPTFLSSDINWS
ncbi:MAG: Fibronectin type domain protein, partial [Gemmataceae bacterium]|nr:Fibronectin type domain protein [Gemmataceae bacterium]